MALLREDIVAALRASGFDLVLKIPIKAYWMRKEVLPERAEDVIGFDLKRAQAVTEALRPFLRSKLLRIVLASR